MFAAQIPTHIISIYQTKGNCQADLKRKILRLTYFTLPYLPDRRHLYNRQVLLKYLNFLIQRWDHWWSSEFFLTQRILISFNMKQIKYVWLFVWVVNFYLSSVGYNVCMLTQIDNSIIVSKIIGISGPLRTFIVPHIQVLSVIRS